MNVFEEIKKRIKPMVCGGINSPQWIPFRGLIEMLDEVEKGYNNGWIPCSERLPEEAYGCLVTVIDCEPVTQTDFESILPYFVGYDGESWNDADGEEIPFEVIAWQPLPPAYKESEEPINKCLDLMRECGEEVE